MHSGRTAPLILRPRWFSQLPSMIWNRNAGAVEGPTAPAHQFIHSHPVASQCRNTHT
jgi:hypothetical protein